MYDDGIEEVEFPTPICPLTEPHAKHRIPGTWRDECPGVQGPEIQHNATGEYACTECGHQGNGNVPGCTCIGCDDACGKTLVEWPYGNCTERAGHAGDCDRRQKTPRQTERNATNAEIVAQALKDLGPGWHTSRELMWQVRRNGWQMTTEQARGVAKELCRQNKAHMLADGGRYSFEILDAELRRVS